MYFVRVVDEEAYKEVVLNDSQVPFDYQIAILTDHHLEKCIVKNQLKAFSYVQPLLDQHLIMAEGRILIMVKEYLTEMQLYLNV